MKDLLKETKIWERPKEINFAFCIVHFAFNSYGGVAQLGEHLPCKQGVMGSNPIISTSGDMPRRKLVVITTETGSSPDGEEAEVATAKRQSK